MARSEVERRDKMVAQANLAALHQHPSWDALEAEVEAQIEGIKKRALARVLHGEPLSPEEQGFISGTIAGLSRFLRQPAQAASRLERLTRQHGTEEEDAA